MGPTRLPLPRSANDMTVKDADGGDVLRSGRRQGGTDRRTPGIRVVPRATNLQTAAVLHLGRITPRLSSRHREGSTGAVRRRQLTASEEMLPARGGDGEGGIRGTSAGTSPEWGVRDLGGSNYGVRTCDVRWVSDPR